MSSSNCILNMNINIKNFLFFAKFMCCAQTAMNYKLYFMYLIEIY